jgi:hypothetical protein
MGNATAAGCYRSERQVMTDWPKDGSLPFRYRMVFPIKTSSYGRAWADMERVDKSPQYKAAIPRRWVYTGAKDKFDATLKLYAAMKQWCDRNPATRIMLPLEESRFDG